MTDDDPRSHSGTTREEFEAEARRQSALAATSPDEKEGMRWLEAAIGLDGWAPYQR
jgi:hypothetical protein